MPKSPAFFRSFFCLVFFTALLAGCENKRPETLGNSAKNHPPKQLIKDDLGRELEIPANPQRVMALSAGMTEMLFAVLPDSQIVGRTQVCNFPAAALKKPVVSSMPLDLEGLLVLKPDLIFTEAGMTSLEAAEQIQRLGIPVYFQEYKKVSDIFRGLTDIGKIMHQENAARKLTDSLQNELNAMVNAKKPTAPKRVLTLISTDPIYVYGRNTLLTDKIQLAGGDNALTEVFQQQSPPLTREYVLQLNPDVIFGTSPEKLETTFFNLYPELKKVTAYRQKQIYQLNDDLASRPGPRVVESIREMRNYLQK